MFLLSGGNLLDALRSGIAAKEAALCAKAAAIAAAVVAKFKSIFAIHSPSRVFRDEIGKMLMLGLRDGILQNSDAVLAACQSLAEDMLEAEEKYASEKERIEREHEEADEAVRRREYSEKLAEAKTYADKMQIIEDERLRLKKKADEEYLNELKENAERQREVVDALKEDISSAYEEIAEYAEGKLEAVIKNREKLENKLKSFGDGLSYEKMTHTGTKTVASKIGARVEVDDSFDIYSLADRQESIDTLKRYASALGQVREKLEGSFSKETARDFMAAMAELDIAEGVTFAETLNAAGNEDFARYINQWSEQNELAEAIAAQFYGEEFTEAVDDCTEYMKTELEALGLDVPDGFFSSGSASAKEFGRGFAEGLNEVLLDARRLIEAFGSYSAELIGSETAPVVNNTNYYSNYSINGTSSSTAESIYAIEAAAMMNKYRGLA